MQNKKTIAILLFLNAVLTVVLIFASWQNKPLPTKAELLPDPLAEIKNTIILSLLQNPIELACQGYYQQVEAAGLVIKPEMLEVLAIGRADEQADSKFLVKVKVTPYADGQPLGIDHLTFLIHRPHLQLLKFAHLQTLPAPVPALEQP